MSLLFKVEIFVGVLILKELLGFFLCSLLNSFQVFFLSFGRECFFVLDLRFGSGYAFWGCSFSSFESNFQNFPSVGNV